ncbi:MAG: hypothetical protein U9N85_01175 [Bacteroidota bacterium]|nr:hypothetical protein [Bacteroidota bacterium]
MSKENKKYDTRTRIESTPKSVIFRKLGGFKKTKKANSKVGVKVV